ncbi:hypothetical protein JRQ81_005610 [Phrynocephalus forsythii]|uniref:Pellino FHA domain-containing protein n=1 Tax=Phrynocephalus forsythii TaxID=171643 RepID=A0A9Q0Y317_9SAUR|nr:hypothetical protein JRQ81_005610 [Phrynocephalus forsythii]
MNGVLVMHPSDGFSKYSTPGVWHKISMCGNVYTLQDSHSAQQWGKLVRWEAEVGPLGCGRGCPILQKNRISRVGPAPRGPRHLPALATSSRNRAVRLRGLLFLHLVTSFSRCQVDRVKCAAGWLPDQSMRGHPAVLDLGGPPVYPQSAAAGGAAAGDQCHPPTVPGGL